MISSVRRVWIILLLASVWLSGAAVAAHAQIADVIYINGKIITVDANDTVAEAMALAGDRILVVGLNDKVLRSRGPNTQVIHLAGRTIIPGLMDSHVHATGASMHEFDHEIPDMRSIADVLDYVRQRAAALGDGQWIVIQQVFITRLDEMRYPTRAELDAAAPKNPVVFRTGPDASLNSLALEHFKITKDSQSPPGSKIEKDPETGEPTGILRGWGGLGRIPSTGRNATEQDRYDRLRALIRDYNSVGLTAVADRNASEGAAELYQKLLENGDLTVRMAMSRGVGNSGSVESIQRSIRKIAAEPWTRNHPMLRTVGVKMFLDGGMLTGSAYMLEPWGVSEIYSIDDPDYRGIRFMEPDKLLPVVRTAIENHLQFTAHSVGDGAVTTLVDTYEKLAQFMPIRNTRPCVTHCNFMTQEAVEKMARLGVVCDIQPAWLYLDTRTLAAHFGYERLAWFQPLAAIFDAGGIVGGGSDHMQKIGSLRSVNPYNPFLGMWVAITRRARDYDGQLHPEHALTRMQALRMYTINNAYLMFADHRSGSLEAGKLADFVVLDRDILTCPVDQIREIKVLRTYLGGKLVYEAR